MKGITISEMKLGDSASFTKTVSEHDVYTYAGVSGDFNPAHVNEVEAQKGMFGKRIAHGMLSAGFISTVLGTQLPGPGTIYGSGAPLHQTGLLRRHDNRYGHSCRAHPREEPRYPGHCLHQPERRGRYKG
ncbi:MAG: MaoC family dehydratase [Lachnospiraceae bacterium]